jgi:hypothetical protein
MMPKIKKCSGDAFFCFTFFFYEPENYGLFRVFDEIAGIDQVSLPTFTLFAKKMGRN